MKITKELLEDNGFELYFDPFLKNLNKKDLDELHKEGYYPEKQFEMRRNVVNKDGENIGKYWFIEMRWDMSNTPGRDWGCHIDNCVHESVAYVDIGTVEQFNKLMDILDIEYRIK